MSGPYGGGQALVLLTQEPQILFDGAAVATGAEAVEATCDYKIVTPEKREADYLNDHNKDAQLFAALADTGEAREQKTEITYTEEAKGQVLF